jgi:hypothetical protein
VARHGVEQLGFANILLAFEFLASLVRAPRAPRERASPLRRVAACMFLLESFATNRRRNGAAAA